MKKLLLPIFLCVVLNASAQWAFRLPAIISDHAVFQQSSDVKLWGWGQSGNTVKIICSWNPTDTVKAEPRSGYLQQRQSSAHPT
jgi:sialate O-acetylesterase